MTSRTGQLSLLIVLAAAGTCSCQHRPGIQGERQRDSLVLSRGGASPELKVRSAVFRRIRPDTVSYELTPMYTLYVMEGLRRCALLANDSAGGTQTYQAENCVVRPRGNVVCVERVTFERWAGDVNSIQLAGCASFAEPEEPQLNCRTIPYSMESCPVTEFRHMECVEMLSDASCGAVEAKRRAGSEWEMCWAPRLCGPAVECSFDYFDCSGEWQQGRFRAD